LQAARNPDALFRPFRLRSLQLRNRVVMAPMTRSSCPDGIPTDEVVAYYRRRAAGEVGLIVTEGAAPERPGARNDPMVPFFYGAALAEWKKVVDAVHAAGGVIAPQFYHVGAAPNSRGWEPPEPYESPSGINGRGEPVGIAMTDDDVVGAIDAYARAGAAARALGFDAIELHGAHGFLIDQFGWAQTNRRTDRWGGATLRERVRFAVEVVRAVRAAIGDELPLILRISQFKMIDYDAKIARTPEELRHWLEPLAEAGVDAFHCSQRRFWEPEFEGSQLNLAGWAKKLTGKATITVGSVGLSGEFTSALRQSESSTPTSLDALLRRLEREEFDLVAVGRSLLGDPNWAVKVQSGQISELVGYHPDMRKSLI
jgi:2,4-dienoyl-CoA reductase-like NADH-dependent reductase (Old Yellow Enzyme family)